MNSDEIKRTLKMRSRRCEKTITMECRCSGMTGSIYRITACRIRRFMVVWNYKNEGKGRWGH